MHTLHWSVFLHNINFIFSKLWVKSGKSRINKSKALWVSPCRAGCIFSARDLFQWQLQNSITIQIAFIHSGSSRQFGVDVVSRLFVTSVKEQLNDSPYYLSLHEQPPLGSLGLPTSGVGQTLEYSWNCPASPCFTQVNGTIIHLCHTQRQYLKRGNLYGVCLCLLMLI